MYTIRECRMEDYEGVALVLAQIQPEILTAQEIIDEDATVRQGGTLHRLVAAAPSGEILGYAVTMNMQWFAEGDWRIRAAVDPAHRRQGIGTALFQAAQAISVEGGATSLTAWTRSEDPANFSWAQGQGFVEDLLRTEAVLDLSDWDGSRFAGALKRVEASGIQLALYDGDVPLKIVEELWDLERLTAPDVPDYDPAETFPTLEFHTQQWYAYKQPRLTAVALDGERVVGCSWLNYYEPASRGGYTGYTAVLREYRGRGIALAVKLLTVEAAVERGVPWMRTNNDFENPGMLRVNEKLGYKMVPGPMRIRKQL